MDLLIKPFVTTTREIIRLTSAAITPFIEFPSSDRDEESNPARDSLNASDLFSLFTADIIKKEVVFVR